MDTSALECPVCLEIFTDPRALKCNHTVCFKCAKQLSQLNPRQVTCPVCRKVTKVKSSLDKDIAPNYALIPVITAYLNAKGTPAASFQTPASTLYAAAANVHQTLPPIAAHPPGHPIVSVDQLNERINQIMACQAHLRAALDHLPVSIGVQHAQIIGQFNLLKQAIEVSQAETLQNLANLQTTVTAQLQQELLTCDSHLMEIELLRNQYPVSVAQTDVAHWLEAENAWRSRLTILQQHGLLGAFSAQVPVTITAPELTYEGHSIDFPELWAVSRDPSYIASVKANKPVKAVHLITHSASGVIRRWNFRDRVTISEVNHPGLRSWALFENGSKLVIGSAKIKVYDTFSGHCLATFESLTSATKRIVASGCDLKARAISFHLNSGVAALWDLSQNVRLNWDFDISAWNTNLVVPLSADSHLLLVPTMSFPFNVLLFNMLTGNIEEGNHLEGFLTDVTDIVPFGEGRYCVTICAGGACAIWDMSKRKVLKSAQLDAKHKQITILKLNKKEIESGKLPVVAAYVSMTGSFSVWYPQEDRVVLVTHNQSALLSSSMRSMLLFNGGDMVLSGHANGKVHVWALYDDVAQCVETLPLSITGQFVLCNKGHNIVFGAPNGYVNVLDTGQLASYRAGYAIVNQNGNGTTSASNTPLSPTATTTVASPKPSNIGANVLQLLPSALDSSAISLHLIGTVHRP